VAGGPGKAVDLVFDDIRPAHGIIAIRFWNRRSGEAMCQAIEIGPSQAGRRTSEPSSGSDARSASP